MSGRLQTWWWSPQCKHNRSSLYKPPFNYIRACALQQQQPWPKISRKWGNSRIQMNCTKKKQLTTTIIIHARTWSVSKEEAQQNVRVFVSNQDVPCGVNLVGGNQHNLPSTRAFIKREKKKKRQHLNCKKGAQCKQKEDVASSAIIWERIKRKATQKSWRD